MPERLPILIAGAGPTGLLLTIWLRHLSIPHRIVDPKPGTGSHSRALIVHARTLELYHMLGFADTVVASGERLGAMRIRYKGEERVKVDTGGVGRGLTRFPFALCLGQDEHEAILLRELQKRGGDVEWGTSVIGVEDKGDWVVFTLERAGTGGNGTNGKGMATRSEVVEVQYVAGCDGGHSSVRRCVGLEMTGGTYDHRFFVADVRGTGSALDVDPSINMCLSPHDFCFVLPLKTAPVTSADALDDGTTDARAALKAARIVGFTPEGSDTDVSFDDCLPSIHKALGRVDIEHVDWFSHYKVHHRHVERFRKGRIFVSGDAAHLHSPVGGQGMNTGLGDVSNFAWKFATHIRTVASHSVGGDGGGVSAGNEGLLDMYHAERFEFAKLLVKTTDTAFTYMMSPSYLSMFIRTVVMPRILQVISKRVDIASKMFAKTSHLGIAYPQSGLSVDQANAGRVKAGDRLPYVVLEDGGSNHDTLDGRGWQAHVYGTAAWSDLSVKGVRVHRFKWDAAVEQVGLLEDALYLVRPDGCVGLCWARTIHRL